MQSTKQGSTTTQGPANYTRNQDLRIQDHGAAHSQAMGEIIVLLHAHRASDADCRTSYTQPASEPPNTCDATESTYYSRCRHTAPTRWPEQRRTSEARRRGPRAQQQISISFRTIAHCGLGLGLGDGMHGHY